jgi:hypothetical protein
MANVSHKDLTGTDLHETPQSKVTNLVADLAAKTTLTAVKVDSDIADAIAKKHSNTLDHSNSLDHSNANDPSADQKAALGGTNGTPSVSNKFVTDLDSRNTDSRTPITHSHTPGDVTGTAVITTDSRLSDARTPTSHALLSHSGTSAATPATTGTMTVNMTTDIITITPTGACTFNAAAGGTIGQIVTFSITTSGTTAYTLTWGTNYRKTGTLSTGTTSARFFAVTFRCINGTIWQEIARTAVQT